MNETSKAITKTEETNGIKRRLTTKSLQYVFSPDESAALAKDLSRKVKEVEDAEARKKAVAAQLKAELEQVLNDQRVLAGKLRDGYEYRDIKCEETKDYIHGLVTLVRLDTGEVVNERAMTVDERQQTLPISDKPPEDGDEPDADGEQYPHDGVDGTEGEEFDANTEEDNDEGYEGEDGYEDDGGLEDSDEDSDTPTQMEF
jgi:hypothetical protein